MAGINLESMVLNSQAIVGSVNAPPHCFEAAIKDKLNRRLARGRRLLGNVLF